MVNKSKKSRGEYLPYFTPFITQLTKIHAVRTGFEPIKDLHLP